ncbi:MAG: restriction endonuclease subunit R, partial [Clostridia bacterium]|nr:restriction endonuclease subunit R [Clostridia bacterium]
MEEYGKSIIMDYSYKYFYNDGYGKDYRIYNLQATVEDDSRVTYLTGCLLSFYQQIRYFEEYGKALQPFNIEKPLLVFVGNKVTATTSASELSDVQEVLQFIDNFVRHKAKTIKRIDDVINERTGLVTDKGTDVFQSGLDALWDIYGGNKPAPEVIYQDVLRYVFNSDSTSDEPRLRVEAIKQVQGEIAMRIGDGEYFGVINIGDTAKLIKQCDDNGIVARDEEFSKESLFRSINKKDSNIKILIGSRKFTEG